MLRRFFFPAMVLLLALWLLAACGSTAAPEVATDTPVPSPTPMSAAAILTAAQEASKEADSFHVDMDMVMTMTMPAAGLATPMRIPITLVGDFQPPDRSQATVTMEMQGTSIDVDMVTISNTTYVKDPTTGVWGSAAQSATPLSPEDLLSFKAEDIVGLTIVGEETIDGMRVYHLAGTTTMPLELGEPLGEASGTVAVDYWIEKETNYVRQAALLGEIPVTGEMTATIELSATMFLSDYGKAVTIEAPEVDAP